MKRCRSLLQLHFHQQSTHYDVDWMNFTEFRVSIIVTNVKKFFGSERRILTSWFTVHEDWARFQTKNAADEWKSFFLCLWNSLVSFEVKTSHLREVFLDLGRNYSWVEHHNVHYWLQSSSLSHRFEWCSCSEFDYKQRERVRNRQKQQSTTILREEQEATKSSSKIF